MTKICSKCLIEKPLSAFHYRKDSQKYRNECATCWKLLCATRAYRISFEQAETYYQHPTCMCCNDEFKTKRDRHLHHVNHQVIGVLCMYCNIALGQETFDDIKRIDGILEFMSRENFFDRVNQQVRQDDGIRLVTSTIRRQTSSRSYCKFCGQLLLWTNCKKWKQKSGNYIIGTSCKKCYHIYKKSTEYGLTFEQAKMLVSILTCECCGLQFSNNQKQYSYVHHVGANIRGVVCRRCNSLLEQESLETKQKLVACSKWLRDDDMI